MFKKLAGKEAVKAGKTVTWQQKWEENEKNLWLHSLMLNITGWIERPHCSVGYDMTQCLTGHGCFQAFLTRIGKAESVKCYYCKEQGTAEQTLFKCPGGAEARTQAEQRVGVAITKENMIDLMTRGAEEWEAVEDMTVTNMTQKEQDERMRKRERRDNTEARE